MKVPVKVRVADLPAALIVILRVQLMSMVVFSLIVTHEETVWGSMLVVALVTVLVSEQTGLPERTRSPEVLVLETDVAVVSLTPMRPGHETITEAPALDSVHVVLAAVLPEKVALPDREVPASSVVAVNSAVGQRVLTPPSVASPVITVLVEVNEILVLAGVMDACAGTAAAAHTVSIATAISRLRVAALRMRFSC